MSDEILRTVERLIVETIGDEVLLTGPITMSTSFGADLELESIEFVALAERLQAHYGPSVDFSAWIAGKTLDQIIGLTVGDLVEFVAACRT